MELGDYLRVLRRRWLLIIGTTAVLVAVAAAYTFTATPQYASESKVVVTAASSKGASASDSAYTTSLAASQRVPTYASLVADGKLTARVVAALGLQMKPSTLADKLDAQVAPDTSIITLTVTDDSATFARRVCDEVTTQLLALIKEIETPQGQTTALFKGTVVSEPTASDTPVSPKPARNLAVGIVLGLLLGVAIAIARELLDTTLKSSDDVEEIVDAPVLGGISADPQTPKQPLVSTLSSHAPRVEAFRVLRTNLQFVDIDSASKIFVVTSSMPGEGKSTTAVNVAITMAQSGQRVLLLDGDLRRPQVANLLDLDNVVGVTTVLLGRIPLADAVQVHPATGLSVLASGAIPPNPAELLQSRSMSELLGLLRADYDVVDDRRPAAAPGHRRRAARAGRPTARSWSSATADHPRPALRRGRPVARRRRPRARRGVQPGPGQPRRMATATAPATATHPRPRSSPPPTSRRRRRPTCGPTPRRGATAGWRRCCRSPASPPRARRSANPRAPTRPGPPRTPWGAPAPPAHLGRVEHRG